LPASSAPSDQAKKDASDLIVFPAVTIQGSTSLDWFLDKDVVRSCLESTQTDHRSPLKVLAAIVGTVRPMISPRDARSTTQPPDF